MLKSLEISGFKSFAKKTELHFKSKVTAIVGPNGSGKSNVAEAFRFVLGEQSMKSMRGKRGEDLIWNGSTETARSNRAKVKLVFDNSKNIFNLDFEEVIIERIVNRDGGNEYYLNSSLVRLKDIIELLSEAHIGASGHHIISQGEADRILSSSIKERKEMIEDALGLKIYQYKREESQRKLLKTEENIKQVESLRREIAPHIRFLKKQVDKVERAEQLRLKLSKFYREYLKREKIYLENQKEKIEKEKNPTLEKLKELEIEMEKAKQILETSSKKDEKSEKLIEIENKIKEERNTKDTLYREIGKIEGELNANQKIIQKIEADQKSEDNKTVPLKEVEKLEKEISEFSEISRIIERIRNFIESHRTKSDPSTNSGQVTNLSELISLNNNLLEKKRDLEEKIEQSNTYLNKFSFEYQKIKDSIEKEKDSGREAERVMFKISSEQSELRSQLNLLEAEVKRIKIIEEDWKREIQEGGVLLGTAILGFENDEVEERSFIASPEPREKQEERRRELEKMKIRLEELGGGGGVEITKEYKETLERDEFLTKELEDLKKSAESLQILIKELLEKLDIEFKNGVEKINKTFQEFFELMFGGGEAELKIERLKIKKLKDLEENFDLKEELSLEESGLSEMKEETGIEISVSLPRKKTKGLEMLSGGERALTSIALLFAISQVNPPPFIILDETDAALDEANSKKYGEMINSLSKFGFLSFPASILQKALSPFAGSVYSAFNFFSSPSKDSTISKIKEENRGLVKKIVSQSVLQKENSALADQFATTSVRSQTLLTAKIVGAPSFIPGVSNPQSLIIDRGTKDNVKVGNAVIYKDNLVGKIVEANLYFSKIDLITSPSFSTTVKILRSQAAGVIKGKGEKQMILDNVLQSSDIKVSNIILTTGDQDIKGIGFPPDLTLGKLISVAKKPSNLFQKGEVVSLLDFSNLSTVFVIRY